MNYNWDFGALWQFHEVFLRGAVMTAVLTVAATVLGASAGLALAFLRASKWRVIRYWAIFYIEFFRTTPALVQLVWIYYSLPILSGYQLSSLTSVAIGLGAHSAAYFAEIFRAGIQSIDRGQTHAARSLGMSHAQTMRRIILPQAVRRMVPPLINEFVTIAKLTTLGSVLAVNELMHESNDLITSVFKPLEIYTVLAVLFFVLLLPITMMAQWFEQRWARGR
jgi:polar amino acid transport system permease protein